VAAKGSYRIYPAEIFKHMQIWDTLIKMLGGRVKKNKDYSVPIRTLSHLRKGYILNIWSYVENAK